MTRTVIAFGETLWDRLPTATVLGGAPFNFAYRINSLGDQGRMISRLGHDALGRQAWEQITALGMDTHAIQWDEQHPTGTVDIRMDAAKNLDITINPDVAYDYIEEDNELLALAASADGFCFGTLVQRMPTSRRTLHRLLDASPNSLKILDLNLRRDCYTPETITASLERADILKLNEQEARKLAALFGLPAHPLAEFVQAAITHWSLRCGVVTLGEKGAYAAASDGQETQQPGISIEVVDTLGSGDAFTAGFVHRYLRGATLEDCCRFGNVLGARVAAQSGATQPISAADIEAASKS